MKKKSILYYIKQLNRPVFSTFELSINSGKSLSTTTQSLNYLQNQGIVKKIYQGIWYEIGNKHINPYQVIPLLLKNHRSYVSFISALHMYDIIEQIPQIITVASTAHTKIIDTALGIFSIHRITPEFFDGFTWYKGTGNFLIAEPEKALVDCLYLSSRRKKQFSYFPELYFPKQFSFKKANNWVKKIPNIRIRKNVQKKLNELNSNR